MHVVAEIRDARERAVLRAKSGELAEILSSPSGFENLVYVVKLLDVDPRLGKVAGRRAMAEAGVSQFARVVDLTAQQREAIIRQCEVTA